MRNIVSFALLIGVVVNADVSHLAKPSTDRNYLPVLTNGQTSDAVPYVLSRPRVIPTPPRISVPHSNLNTFVADLPLKRDLFRPARAVDSLQPAGSDQVVYATAPNSVFHTQINVQSQGSEFNAPNTAPISVDSEDGRRGARVDVDNFFNNDHFYEYPRSRQPQHDNHVRKTEHDLQRSHHDFRSYHSTKSPIAYRQEIPHRTDHSHTDYNDVRSVNGHEGKKTYDNPFGNPKFENQHSYGNHSFDHEAKNQTDQKNKDDHNSNFKSGDHRANKSEHRAHDYRNHSDCRSEDKTDSYKNNHNGQIGQKGYDDHSSSRKGEDHRKYSDYDSAHEININKNFHDSSNYKAEGRNLHRNERDRFHNGNYKSISDGYGGEKGYDDQREEKSQSRHDKTHRTLADHQTLHKDDPRNYHSHHKEKKTYDDHYSLRGDVGRAHQSHGIENHRTYDTKRHYDHSRSHDINKFNNNQRTEYHPKRRSNYQGLNLLNGNIAAGEASRLPQPPENLHGNTQGINIINGNILGDQYQTHGRILNQRNAYSEQNYGQNRHEELYPHKENQYHRLERSVAQPSAIKIIAFNNNNNNQPLSHLQQVPQTQEGDALFAAENTEFEHNPSASGPEVIYKSGDEIDFAETKLVDYSDNQRPLDGYKFSGKRGPQRKKNRFRGDAILRSDGYHYSKPSLSFNS